MTFSTGLSAAEFAKQKQSYLLTLCGCVLCEQGGAGTGLFSYEEWRAEGVKEESGLMVVYGKAAGGERLDALLERDKETALSALLLWKAGLDFLRDKMIFEGITAAPCAVFVDLAARTLFFPPRDIIRIAVESEGKADGGASGTSWLSGAKRWMHPDKQGTDAVNWTFAACLYRVFAGFAPFAVPLLSPSVDMPKPKKRSPADLPADIHTIEDTLLGDVREGALVPAALAVPGLREDIARFIDTAIARNSPQTKPAVIPPPSINNEYAKNITPVPPETLAAIAARREEIERKNRQQIRRKRFFARNRTVIGGVAAGVVILGLVIGSLVQAQLERWSTKGLTPVQVVEQYYGAFGSLDHETMSACVEDNAGKADVEMVTNLFVVARMREAYEQKRTVINASEWDGTEPPPDTTVFGVLDMTLDWPGGGESGIGESGGNGGEVTARARYDLMVPQSFVDGSENGGPARVSREDTLQLQWRKDRWRIIGIERRERF